MLLKSKSKKAFSHNVETEMDSGKPQKQALAIAYSMKKKAKKMAMGGMASSCTEHCNSPCEVHEQANLPMEHDEAMERTNDAAMAEDMVGRIMQKRMSKGGMVANDTPITAGFKENDFDDLVLRDDLESSYTGKNSGDELGNDQEDEDRKDMVTRIMKSRAKKDRLPNPL